MKKKKERVKTACVTPMEGEGCCGVKAVIAVDERGQIVLPKEVRDEAGIKNGDKFAVITMKHGGKVCCISLMKVDELSNMVMVKLGPMLGKIKGSDKHEGK